jgi:hypothetical protein
MAKALTTLLLLLLTTASVSASVSCNVEDSLTGIRTIAWNDTDGTATVTDMFHRSHVGKISLRTKRNDGEKVNIYIHYEQPYYGQDAAEYIVFPAKNGLFRVIGVTYVSRSGKNYLSTFEGSYLATCINTQT